MFGGPFGMGGMMGGMGGMEPVLVTRGGQPMGVVAVPVGMGPMGPMGAPFPGGDDILLEALRRQLRDDSPSPRGDSSACLELYHETSPEAAASILRSQRMYRGSDGLAGGGIYFAESPSEARRKAHQHRAMLKATVRVGRMKVAHVALRGDTEHVQGCTCSVFPLSATASEPHDQLKRQGFDSVKLLGRDSGTEYIVYNWDQVTNIREV